MKERAVSETATVSAADAPQNEPQKWEYFVTPLLLHNDGPWASEGDDFMSWYERGIVAHYRFPGAK